MIKDRHVELCDEKFFTVLSVDDYLDQSAFGCWRTFEMDQSFADLKVNSRTGRVSLVNTLSLERV